MIDHYRMLSRRAEERRVRAVWRRKKFALSLERVQLMEKDREEWKNLMSSSDAAPHLGETDKEDGLTERNQENSPKNELQFETQKSTPPPEKPFLSATEDTHLSNVHVPQLASLTSSVTEAATAVLDKPHSSDCTSLDSNEDSSVVKERMEQAQLLPAQSQADTQLEKNKDEVVSIYIL